MKKQICVTVDVDTWMVAKQKIPNISEYLNESLRALNGKTENEFREEELLEQVKAIDNSMQELTIKRTILNMDIKLLRENKIIAEKQRKEDEAYTRWVCPVCQQKNSLEDFRCGNCSLPTKNDKRTVIVSIKEEAQQTAE